MRAARLGGIPAPEVLREEALRDASCLLTTWCPGETLATAILESGADPRRLGWACGQLQAQLHAIDAPPDLAGGRSWLTPTPEEERLLTGARHVQSSRLLHLDFHPLNILTDGRKITGVVDWVNAAAGDPRQDLARSLAILKLALQPEVAASPTLTSAVHALIDGWLAGYEAEAGPQRQLNRFMAWAGLRTVRDLSGKRSPAALRTMADEVAKWIGTVSD